MKTTSTLFTVIALTGSALSAQVTFDFNTTSDTEGFVADAATSVAQDTFNGGSLKVTGAPGGGDFSEAASRAAKVPFTGSSPLSDELALAYDFGGTITFDMTVFESDIVWVDGDRPGLLEFQLTLEGIGRDTEVNLFSVPGVGSSATRNISMNIVQGSGNQFNGTNGTINFDDSATGNLYFGFKDGADFITSATFYLDNITVTAIPEPSTFAALAGMLALGFVMVRRRS